MTTERFSDNFLSGCLTLNTEHGTLSSTLTQGVLSIDGFGCIAGFARSSFIYSCDSEFILSAFLETRCF